ncbi:hypothetical protein [Okeania sp. SIO2B3]|uniref:hypothetical protein n=1 Tax=Okeania sp. SIO2B3 TaxID=2607784 RepID=UPI0013C08214|nr:hypothetical protein [Okeania sp. SIO2B3]NET46752.1 hypothetical protein [Okeania sp. SIO2B3]
MEFSFIAPVPVNSYVPPTFNNFSILPAVSLPNGGTAESPAVGSVIKVLASSTNFREYYILNTGGTTVRLFFGGSAVAWQDDVRTPFISPPGDLRYSSLSTCMLSVFAWSDGRAGKLILGVFE